MVLEGSLYLDIQGETILGLVDMNLLNQEPQVGFRHLSIGKDLVNEADVFLQLRLPGADGLT